MWTESKMPKSHADVQDLPDGYRMTELGPLPKEWRVVRLGEVLHIIPKKERRVVIQEDKQYTLLSVGLYSKGVSVKEVILGKDLKTKTWYQVKNGDFLLLKIWARKGAYGFVWGIDNNAIVSSDYPILQIDQKLANDRYVEFYLSQSHVWQRLSKGAKGTTNRQRVHEREFVQIIVLPLPPLSEQRAIAHVLRTVQEAREATERVIAALRDLKRSLMRHLFTYGPVPVDAVGQVALQDTPIGPIPAHWRVVRLGEVAHKPQYGYTASATPEPVGPKFLRITDIQNDRVHWASVPFCVIEDALLNKYRLREGDILFARIGATTGKTYLVREAPRAVFASYLIRVRAHSNQLLPEYLYFFTHTSQYWQQINAAKGGRLKLGINIPILTSLHIPLPLLPEQREIARILQTVDRKIEAEEARKEMLDDLFRSLLHHLVTAKIRLPADFIAQFAVGAQGLMPLPTDSP